MRESLRVTGLRFRNLQILWGFGIWGLPVAAEPSETARVLVEKYWWLARRNRMHFACRFHGFGREREFFIDNQLVRIHFIILMIRWTGLAPWEYEFPFPGSLTPTFLEPAPQASSAAGLGVVETDH